MAKWEYWVEFVWVNSDSKDLAGGQTPKVPDQVWINPPQSATMASSSPAEVRRGEAMTFSVGPAPSDNGKHLAVVEEMLSPAREEKYSPFSNGALSHND